MTLNKLINKLSAAANSLKANGLDPDTVKVVIHHDNRECTGDIVRVQAFKKITRDAIPYDVDPTVNTIRVGDNVVIIEGDY